jgi:hypothetical protein
MYLYTNTNAHKITKLRAAQKEGPRWLFCETIGTKGKKKNAPHYKTIKKK